MPKTDLIGGVHSIDNTLWALSLVRQKKQGEEGSARFPLVPEGQVTTRPDYLLKYTLVHVIHNFWG